MLLTVAVCTRDRAASLQRTLDSLVACAPPADESWEVIVVDNGSADHTPAVVAGFQRTLPIRRIAEATPGLSQARNAAVHAAQGEYMIWTDDDCTVDRQWLAAYTTAFRQWPKSVLFGGPIVPRFEGRPPTWLTRVASRVGTAYAARDLGAEPVALALEGNLVPFGANFAIRTVEQRCRPYDHRIGRGTGLPMSVGEESEVLEGLLRDGAAGRWVPRAMVTHNIPPERQRLSYLREYYAACGAYEEWRRHASPVVHTHGDERSAMKELVRGLKNELRYQVLRRLARPESWIDALIIASEGRGRRQARLALEHGTLATHTNVNGPLSPR